MASDLSFGVSLAGVSDAIAALQRVGAAIRTTGDDTAATGTKTRRAADDNEEFARSLASGGQRIAGFANSIASLTTRLGDTTVGRGAGLVGAMANAASQGAQLGMIFGPTGTVVGAIGSALIPILGEAVSSLDDTAEATAHVTESVDDLVESYTRMQTAAALTQRLSDGTATLDERWTAATEAQARYDAQTRRTVELQNQLNALEREDGTTLAALVGGPFAAEEAHRREVIEQLRQQIEQSRTLTDALQEEAEKTTQLAAAEQALSDRAAEAISRNRTTNDRRSPDARARDAAAAADQLAQDTDARFANLRDQLNDLETGPIAGMVDAMREAEQALSHAWESSISRSADAGDAYRELVGVIDALTEAQENARLSDEAFERQKASDAEQAHLRRAEEERDLERQRAIAEETKRHEEHILELRDAADQASESFHNGYVASIDSVIDAYRRWQSAAKAAGQEVNASGQLMQRGMTAVANNIADAVGGTMKGAFESALGAWLDGSKSFVQAAEDMAKGVLKALVTESIVQAVTETARGIADLASYHYDSAALHFAAAGAWAAVGVVAGGIGGAVGAFGGGGADKQGATTRDTASPAREAQQGGGGTNLTMYVYPGGYITQREVNAGILDALRQAAREGGQMPQQWRQT